VGVISARSPHGRWGIAFGGGQLLVAGIRLVATPENEDEA
jgi:hypothetical protein